MPAKPKTGRRRGRPNRREGAPTEALPRPAAAAPIELVANLGARRQRVSARDVEIMLAESRAQPFSGSEWIFELKYDGYRLLVARENGQPLLLFRRGGDVTATFPEISRAVRALPFDGVMDGELVVLDESGRPSFQRLQQRAQTHRAADIERVAAETPATVFLFDLLGLDGYDVRSLPLLSRKRVLSGLLPRSGPLRFADYVEERGEELFDSIRRLGLEGMIAKLSSRTFRRLAEDPP